MPPAAKARTPVLDQTDDEGEVDVSDIEDPALQAEFARRVEAGAGSASPPGSSSAASPDSIPATQPRSPMQPFRVSGGATPGMRTVDSLDARYTPY